MTKEDKEDLAEELAKKVFALKEEKEEREKQESSRKEVWEEGNNFLVCKFSSKYKEQPIPPEILKFKRGNFGKISKNMENGEPIPKFEVGRHLKEHKESNFDLWCKRMSKEEKGKSKSFEEENKEAGLHYK